MPTDTLDPQTSKPLAWGAIYAMALRVFVLVAFEFMSVSLPAHRPQQQGMRLR
jgi:hypothetical protein